MGTRKRGTILTNTYIVGRNKIKMYMRISKRGNETVKIYKYTLKAETQE